MSPTVLTPAPIGTTLSSPRTRWAGRIISGIAILFLGVDAAMKLVRAKAAVDGTVQLGFAPHLVTVIGLILLVCLGFYVVPRTAPLGAVLLTGYLGGAVAAQLRMENPFIYTLSPVYVAAFVWGGLYLRDSRVRAMLRRDR